MKLKTHGEKLKRYGHEDIEIDILAFEKMELTIKELIEMINK